MGAMVLCGQILGGHGTKTAATVPLTSEAVARQSPCPPSDPSEGGARKRSAVGGMERSGRLLACNRHRRERPGGRQACNLYSSGLQGTLVGCWSRTRSHNPGKNENGPADADRQPLPMKGRYAAKEDGNGPADADRRPLPMKGRRGRAARLGANRQTKKPGGEPSGLVMCSGGVPKGWG